MKNRGQSREGTLVDSVYRCKCGGAVTHAGTRNGYPAFRCVICGVEWWNTTCWKNFRHLIDGRVAKLCSCCKYYHCPICNACNPSDDCKCDGDCKIKP